MPDGARSILAKRYGRSATQIKANKEHIVRFAPPAALKILTRQPLNSDFVFAAPRSSGAMERHALADVMKGMGRRETVHGFPSFSDWAADSTAFPQGVREQVLAHAIQEVEAALRRGALLEKRRRLMVDWATFCTVPAVPAGDVVLLRSRGT